MHDIFATQDSGNAIEAYFDYIGRDERPQKVQISIGCPDGKTEYRQCTAGCRCIDNMIELIITWDNGKCEMPSSYSVHNSQFAFINQCLIIKARDIWGNPVSLDMSLIR